MALTKEQFAAAFVPAESSKQADWVGTWADMFSSDDTNPDSRRFIDLDETSGELQVSADTGVEKWGRRFDKTTSSNPILVAADAPNARKTSLLSTVPQDAPVYEEAVAGALDFTLIMGTAFGEKVIKWNGVYDGKGGKFRGEDMPATDCGSFWGAFNSKEDYAAAFVPAESSEQADWVGTYVDIFSLDDTNPDSRRFIDLDETSGELQASADTAGDMWGKRFDKTTSVHPILVATDAPNARKISFLSKVPEDAPDYEEAVAGAFDFTLIMGTAFGEKVIKWNGVYDGKGGKFGGEDKPATDCDKFWRFV